MREIIGISGISEQEAEHAIATLNDKYGFKREQFRQNLSGAGLDAAVDYNGRSMTRTYVCDSKLTDTNFDNAALTGSLFYNTDFVSCSFEQSDFEFCDFIDVNIITPKSLYGTSFNNSSFQDFSARSAVFDGCTFTGALFENATLIDTVIQHCTFENAVLNHCSFEDVQMKELNLEFSELIAPHMERVVLPLAQIPYVFGLLSYLRDSSTDIRISTRDSAPITVQEFFQDVIKHLIVYYTSMNEFFPLASIYISQGEKEKADRAIRAGMRFSGAVKDFRMIKYYCKLAERSQMYTKPELQSIYLELLRSFPEDMLSMKERRNLAKHTGEIKAVLFANSSLSKLQMTLNTNIEDTEGIKIGVAIETIYHLVSLTGSERQDINITLSRNTPITLNIDYADLIENLYIFVPTILCLTAVAVTELTKKIYEIKLIKEQLRNESKDAKLRDKSKIEDMTEKQVQNCISESYNMIKEHSINFFGPVYFISDSASSSSKKLEGSTGQAKSSLDENGDSDA